MAGVQSGAAQIRAPGPRFRRRAKSQPAATPTSREAQARPAPTSSAATSTLSCRPCRSVAVRRNFVAHSFASAASLTQRNRDILSCASRRRASAASRTQLTIALLPFAPSSAVAPREFGRELLHGGRRRRRSDCDGRSSSPHHLRGRPASHSLAASSSVARRDSNTKWRSRPSLALPVARRFHLEVRVARPSRCCLPLSPEARVGIIVQYLFARADERGSETSSAEQRQQAETCRISRTEIVYISDLDILYQSA